MILNNFNPFVSILSLCHSGRTISVTVACRKLEDREFYILNMEHNKLIDLVKEFSRQNVQSANRFYLIPHDNVWME